jgi:23S rRNA (cytosine1962-C5)-methyltransferase
MHEDDTPSAPAAPTAVHLKPGKDRAVRLGHPWIFSGALADLDPGLPPGTVVDVLGSSGEFLARGYATPKCSIAVRVLTHRQEAIDTAFIRRRLERALDWRRRCIEADTDAYRLINGEGDGLPGFVVDVYGEFAVLQALTAGAERLKTTLVEALAATLPLRGVYERSRGNVRREEGLAQIDAVVWGEAPPDVVEVREHGHRLLVDVRGGQKTGAYLDQRPNRALVQRLARDARVLNAFAYTGSFAVAAAAGGAATVVSVDGSEPALELADRQWLLNGLPAEKAEFLRGDVFTYLRTCEEVFDLLILDPPALIKRRQDVARGARAYKDLNLHGFRRAAPGALVFTFTCSQHLSAELFRKIVAGAAADAGRRVQALAALGPGLDHPALLAHPEGEYLRGLLLRVED